MMLTGVEEPIQFNRHIDYAYEDKIAPEILLLQIQQNAIITWMVVS
jgi:hypothetical protein